MSRKLFAISRSVGRINSVGNTCRKGTTDVDCLFKVINSVRLFPGLFSMGKRLAKVNEVCAFCTLVTEKQASVPEGSSF